METVLNNVLLIQRHERICTLKMNRPRIMNAINSAMIQKLQEAFDEISSDEEVRVVILEGAEGNFSAGADMRLLKEELGAPESFQGMKRLGRLIRTMRELPQPIICKVRGVAYGGGANLVLAGDFALASHNARFCEVFVNIGVILDGGGFYFLPRLVGLAKAREIALLGEEIDGKTAASIGLIYKSVPDEDLDHEVDTLAHKLSKKSLPAMTLIKKGLEGSLSMSLQEVLEWEASHQAVMFQTSEHKEAVRLFFESRKKRI
jgi:2-(1,2-epoxy-1,2-dihydrophenyl)acetyl-CoA isomerase